MQSFLPFAVKNFYNSVLSKRMLKAEDFSPEGKAIIKVERYAKWLIFSFDSGDFLLSHLGMSGSWRMTTTSMLHEKHAHFAFTSQCQSKFLTYVDPRRFGHLYLLNASNYRRKTMGRYPDILSLQFDLDLLTLNLYSKSNKIIKPFLLDQNYFPGIGNYMASEICAHAKILPTRPAGSLDSVEIEKLKNAIKNVAEGAIERNGTTFSGGYVDAYGEKGKGVQSLIVFYQKYCQICLENEIKSPITKIEQLGRGTYYCSVCQS